MQCWMKLRVEVKSEVLLSRRRESEEMDAKRMRVLAVILDEESMLDGGRTDRSCWR